MHQKGARFVLFGDSVSYHTSKVSNDIYSKYRTRFIRSVPLEPDLDPIETYFLALKTAYKCLRLDSILNRKNIGIDVLIRRASSNLPFSRHPKTFFIAF